MISENDDFWKGQEEQQRREEHEIREEQEMREE